MQFEDEYVKVEYVDEMGRTRVGTRKEAREAEQEKQKQRTGRETESSADGARTQGPQSAHEEVL
jgi:large subunit ribosomal protein L24e